jgi:hypothetical protein
MYRRSLFITLLIVLGLGSSAGAVVALLIRYEPAFYRRSAVAPGEERVAWSREFIRQIAALFNSLHLGTPWVASFDQDQINSYLEEDFVREHDAQSPFPQGISEPRVALTEDKIQFGFRYGTGWRSTVITVDLHAWLVDREPNLVALEFQSLKAGGLPISAQSLLARITEAAHKNNIDSTWYRYHGHPVLLLRFQANRSSPTFQFQKLEVSDGRLEIAGRSLDGGEDVQ